MSSTADNAASRPPLWLVLSDADEVSNQSGALHASWTVATPQPGIESIPALAEQHALRIRAEYLTWLGDLAHTDIGGQTLEARLRCPTSGLSFWHMSLIAEKSPMKSAGIHTIFKLRALEILYASSTCHGLEYRGANGMLARILEKWMLALDHPFRHPFAGTAVAAQPRRLPRVLSAWAYLARKLWHEVRPARRGAQACAAGASGALPLNVFTYFPNFSIYQSTGRY